MGKMTYKQAVIDILKQFESYQSNCLQCTKECIADRMRRCCEDNDLICREKLIQAAEELDQDNKQNNGEIT